MYTVYTATMANAHWPFGASVQWALTIVAYTSDTRWVKAFQSYTAKQRYTALYSIQLYIAIHYTPSTTYLQHPSGQVHGKCTVRISARTNLRTPEGLLTLHLTYSSETVSLPKPATGRTRTGTSCSARLCTNADLLHVCASSVERTFLQAPAPREV